MTGPSISDLDPLGLYLIVSGERVGRIDLFALGREDHLLGRDPKERSSLLKDGGIPSLRLDVGSYPLTSSRRKCRGGGGPRLLRLVKSVSSRIH